MLSRHITRLAIATLLFLTPAFAPNEVSPQMAQYLDRPHYWAHLFSLATDCRS